MMISLIFNIILVITVVMQYRHITEQTKYLKKLTFSERSIKDNQSESKTVDPTSKITESRDSISDKEKIKNLKSQISDMQDWQDYLEKDLSKYETTREERYYNASKSIYSSRFEPFFDENNISPAKKTEFIKLLAQRQVERLGLDKNSMDAEDFQKEDENIKSKYDDLISNLLSEENYIAYHDFLKSEEDRPYISGFKEIVFTGDKQLDKQQEKDLLAAISNKRLDIEGTEGISIYGPRNEESLEDVKKAMNAHKKLLNGYLEVSKNILTNSQFTKFKKFIDLQISSIETKENQLPKILEIMNSDKE